MDLDGKLFNYVAHLFSFEPVAVRVGRVELGIDGIADAKTMHPSLVVVDTVCAGMMGLNVIYELRGAFSEVGIIAVGNTSSKSNETASSECGADAYVLEDDLDKELVPVARALLGYRSIGP